MEGILVVFIHSGSSSRELSQTGSQIKGVLALISMWNTKIRVNSIVEENILEKPNHLHKKTKQ